MGGQKQWSPTATCLRMKGVEEELVHSAKHMLLRKKRMKYETSKGCECESIARNRKYVRLKICRHFFFHLIGKRIINMCDI